METMSKMTVPGNVTTAQTSLAVGLNEETTAGFPTGIVVGSLALVVLLVVSVIGKMFHDKFVKAESPQEDMGPRHDSFRLRNHVQTWAMRSQRKDSRRESRHDLRHDSVRSNLDILHQLSGDQLALCISTFQQRRASMLGSIPNIVHAAVANCSREGSRYDIAYNDSRNTLRIEHPTSHCNGLYSDGGTLTKHHSSSVPELARNATHTLEAIYAQPTHNNVPPSYATYTNPSRQRTQQRTASKIRPPTLPKPRLSRRLSEFGVGYGCSTSTEDTEESLRMELLNGAPEHDDEAFELQQSSDGMDYDDGKFYEEICQKIPQSKTNTETLSDINDVSTAIQENPNESSPLYSRPDFTIGPVHHMLTVHNNDISCDLSDESTVIGDATDPTQEDDIYSGLSNEMIHYLNQGK